MTVEDLVLANGIEDPDFIGQGTVLTIPVAAPVEVGGSEVTATVVAEGTVVPGLPLSLSPPPSVTVDSLLASSPAILEEIWRRPTPGPLMRDGLSCISRPGRLPRMTWRV